MTNPSIHLICATCSHNWVQDLAQIETFKIIERNGQFAKIHRVPCPICGHILIVETNATPDDIPTSWNT